MSEKPMVLPAPDRDSAEYWEGCKRRELLIKHCLGCGTFRYPPGPGCPECGSLECDWVKIRGEGVVFSFIIVPVPTHPAFEDKVPYNVVVISLTEAGGVHMVSNLIDCRNEDIYIGMPVEVVFQDVYEGVTLPLFRPVRK